MSICFYLADFYQLHSFCFEFLHIFGDFEDDVALDGHGDGGWSMVGTRAAMTDWEEVGDQWRLVVMEDRTLASSTQWHTIRLFLIIFFSFFS